MALLVLVWPSGLKVGKAIFVALYVIELLCLWPCVALSGLILRCIIFCGHLQYCGFISPFLAVIDQIHLVLFSFSSGYDGNCFRFRSKNSV